MLTVVSSVIYTTYMKYSNEVVKNAARIKELEKAMKGKAAGYRDSVFQRFPFVFLGLSTFGLVATLYGFEKLIDTIPFISEHPEILLGVGLGTLLFTGTLYNKLS